MVGRPLGRSMTMAATVSATPRGRCTSTNARPPAVARSRQGVAGLGEREQLPVFPSPTRNNGGSERSPLFPSLAGVGRATAALAVLEGTDDEAWLKGMGRRSQLMLWFNVLNFSYCGCANASLGAQCCDVIRRNCLKRALRNLFQAWHIRTEEYHFIFWNLTRDVSAPVHFFKTNVYI